MSKTPPPKPIIGSQRFRVIQKIQRHIADTLNLRADDLFTIYHPRVCQIIDFNRRFEEKLGQKVVWNILADAAILNQGRTDALSGSFRLLIFLDREIEPYKDMLHELRAQGVPYIFSQEENILDGKIEIPKLTTTDRKVNDEVGSKSPFTRSEIKFLSSIAGAINRKEFSKDILITGQTVLSSFTEFKGYRGTQSQTDCDLLLCTPPPVSIPLLGIEIDGPHHYSLDYWIKDKRGNINAAKNALSRELEKTRQKDHAFEEAGIPLLRVRVEKATSNTLASNLDLLTRLIDKLLVHLVDLGLFHQKMYAYVQHISSRFIDAQDNNYFSETPELEDLVHTAPQLLDFLLNRLIQSQRELQATEDKESMYVTMAEPLFDDETMPESLYFLNMYRPRLEKLAVDELLEQMHIESKVESSKRESTLLASMKIVFRPRYVAPRVMKSISRRAIPWVGTAGYLAEDMKEWIEGAIGELMARHYVKSLTQEEKLGWKERLIRHVAWQESVISKEVDQRKLQSEYKRSGISALQKRIDERLAGAIRSTMESRGYIIRELTRSLGARYHWAHKKSEMPGAWDKQGERYPIGLDKLFDVLPHLDELTTEQIYVNFKLCCEKETALYRCVSIPERDANVAIKYCIELNNRLKVGSLLS